VVNEARKQRRRSHEPPVEESGRSTAENGTGDSVRALLAALPERQRLVLFLRYYADLDYHSIADALGIAVGTVGAALNAAHAALRRQLQEVER
jgi:RNA polymerase sigma factor (sigma-70 family)